MSAAPDPSRPRSTEVDGIRYYDREDELNRQLNRADPDGVRRDSAGWPKHLPPQSAPLSEWKSWPDRWEPPDA